MAINLYQSWASSPYNDANLAKKTFSYRLPVHIAARLAAIEEMFPEQSRSEIVIGILKAGLSHFEQELPCTKTERRPTEEELTAIAQEYDGNLSKVRIPVVTGPKADYCDKANEHYVALESERGNKEPKPPFKP